MCFEMRAREVALRNSFLGTIFDGSSMNRFDSKCTSLPWAYIGLNNSLKVITNAEVQKIVIHINPPPKSFAKEAAVTQRMRSASRGVTLRSLPQVPFSTGAAVMWIYARGTGVQMLIVRSHQHPVGHVVAHEKSHP
jgi:hypothetical protein